MSSMEWEAERLYVMEMLKENKAGLAEIIRSLNDFKLEVTRSVTELKTKLGLYALFGSGFISLTISIATKFIGN